MNHYVQIEKTTIMYPTHMHMGPHAHDEKATY